MRMPAAHIPLGCWIVGVWAIDSAGQFAGRTVMVTVTLVVR